MRLIIALSLLCSVALAKKTYPLNFDYTKLKSIWESPELAHVRPKVLQESPGGGRIVGGEFAHHGQFPHHVLTIIDGGYWCGGSLIYENWVLTVRRFL